MARVLVVKNPFGGRAIGDRITDPSEIEQILSGEHSQHVIRSDHADAHPGTSPEPETATEEE